MFNEIGTNASEKYTTNGKTGLDLYLTKTRTLVESTLMPFYFSVLKEFSERFEKYYAKKLEDARIQGMLDKFIFTQGSSRITAIDDTTRRRIQDIISNHNSVEQEHRLSLEQRCIVHQHLLITRWLLI